MYCYKFKPLIPTWASFDNNVVKCLNPPGDKSPKPIVVRVTNEKYIESE